MSFSQRPFLLQDGKNVCSYFSRVQLSFYLKIKDLSLTWNFFKYKERNRVIAFSCQMARQLSLCHLLHNQILGLLGFKHMEMAK